MLLSVSAVCAEDLTSLDLNETNIVVENSVSSSISVDDEQEVFEDLNNCNVNYVSEYSSNDSLICNNDLSKLTFSNEKEITNGPVSDNSNSHIYVDPLRGSDGWNGSASYPVKTILRALDLVDENGIIHLANGEYYVEDIMNIHKDVTIVGQSKDKTICRSGNGKYPFYGVDANVNIYNCSFVNTHNSDLQGSVIFGYSGNITMVNCSFVNNSAKDGAIIYSDSGSVVLTDCSFVNNSGQYIIGTINDSCSVFNCSFVNNSITMTSVIYARNSLAVNNSAFVNNSNFDKPSIRIDGGSLVVNNSAFVNNVDYEIISYTDVRFDVNGNWWGNNTGWKNKIIIDGKYITPNSFVVLDISVVETSFDVYDVIAKFYLNGTQSLVNISRDIEFKSGSEIITNKMINGVSSNTYSLLNDTKDVRVTLDNEVHNLTLKLDPALRLIVGSNLVYDYYLEFGASAMPYLDGEEVTFIIDNNEEYTFILSDGGFYFYNLGDVSPIYLDTGYHTIVVKYAGNDKYAAAEVSKNVFVKKNELTPYAFVSDINYGEDLIINVALGMTVHRETNVVKITVNGTSYFVETNSRGVGTLTIPGLSAGSYEVVSSLVENSHFYGTAVLYIMQVNKVAPSINVSVDNINVGEDAVINVNLSSDATGDVIISVDGVDYTVAIVDGKATKTISGLKGGNYDVVVRYDGDNNYKNISTNVDFTVSGVTPFMNVTVGNIVFGNDLTVNAVLPVDATGDVIISVGGKEYTVSVVNGKVTQVISGLNAGNHVVNVKYNGDNKYMPMEAAKMVSVAKANADIGVIIADVDYKGIFTVDATLNGVNGAKLTGNVIVTVDGKRYVVGVVDGKGSLAGVALPAGNYEFTATWEGNDNYNPTASSGNFNVNKITPSIDVSVDNINVGEDAVISVSVPVDATGNIIVTVDGKEYTVAIVDGEATKTISGLNEGNCIVDVKYSGDNNYDGVSTSDEFSVSKINPSIGVVIEDIIFGNDLTVNAVLPVDATGDVIISVDGKEYTVSVVDGKVTQVISGLNAGNYDVVIKYGGNDKYNSAEATKTVSVAKANADIGVIIADIDYKGIFAIDVTLRGVNGAALTGNVVVTVDGKEYVVGVVDGKGSLAGVALPAGSYEFTATWEGNDNYNPTASSGNFNVNKIASSIDVSVEDIKVGEDAVISVSVPVDATGNVIVTVDGKNYSGAVVNGKAVIKIDSLKEGNYTVNVEYLGDNNYNGVSTSTKFNVSKVNPVMNVIVGDTLFGSDLIIKAVLPSDINGTVIISVNGVEKTASVVNGKVYEVIPGLDAGNCIIIVRYDGNDKYNSVESNATISIDKISPNLDVVIADVDYKGIFTVDVTLTGVRGAVLTGNVVVTVDGKEYVVGVVDGKGSLAGVALPAGNYEFTAIWEGNDNYNSTASSGNFNVNKIAPSVDVSVDDINVGEDAVITVSVLVDATGNVIVTVDGKNYTLAIVDGKAVIKIAGLKSNEYNVNVEYLGDNNYDGVSASDEFSVSKINPSIDIVINDIIFGNDLTVNAILPEDIDGDVIISVNGVDYTVAIVDGKVTQVISSLNAGNYDVVIKYTGDDKYNSAEATKTVSVAKANADIDVIIADIDYKGIFAIDVTLNGVNGAKLTGNVIVTVDGKRYVVGVVNGKGSLAGVALPAGNYRFTATWEGNDNYNSTVSSGNFNVNKIAPSINVSVDNINVGEDAVISVSVPVDATGNVIVTVDGVDYTLAIVDGKAVIKIAGLKSNEYNVDVKYSGDNNYDGASASAKFNVSKVDPVINIIVNDIVFGNDLTVDVVLPEDINGTVSVIVNGVGKTVSVINGKVQEVVSGLIVGTQIITVKYEGNDKYNSAELNKFVSVAKANPNLDVIIADVDYKGIFTVDATLNGVNDAKLTGNVVVTVDGKEYVVGVVDGKGSLDGVALPAGNYEFTATWEGNDNYNSTVSSGNFNVNKIAPSIDVSVDNINVGEDAVINVNLSSDATGDVIITVDGVDYTVAIVDGKATKTIAGLKEGNYTVNVKYSGDNNYEGISTNAKFTVFKSSAVLNVIVGNIVFGEDLTVSAILPSDATGDVIISVGGNEYTVSVVDGKVTQVISGLNAGNYVVSVKYAGDDKYKPVEVSKFVSVAKANPNLDVVIADVDYKGIFTVDATLRGVNGAVLTGNVVVTVDGKEYVVGVVDGKGSLAGVALPAGNYEFTAAWEGNDNYNPISSSGNFNVNKIAPSVDVSVDDIKVGDDAVITVNVPVDATGNVTVTVDGKNYTGTVVDGKIIINISNLKEGNYTVNVKYLGDDNYNGAMCSGRFNVSKVEDYNTNITIPEGIDGKNSTISIDLPEDATGNVTVIIDGKNYTGPVINGTADVIIPPLDMGDHNVTIIYPGDDKYDPVNKTGNITVVINKDSVLFVDDVVMFYHDGSKLFAVLKDFYGNPIANAILTITINGISYNRTTDENGSAFLTLNLDSGDFIVTVSYLGNDYYNGVSVNASVKIIQSIIADGIVKMYQNDTQFFATFTDNQGNPLANTKVKFNINGVFYERQTNEKGTARLNINLRPGEYVLTAYNPVTGEEKGFNITVKALITENHDIVKYYKNGTQYTAKVYNKDGTLAVGKNVTFNINGVFYNRTVNSEGVVTLAINLNPGSYVITAIYDGYAVGNKVVVHTVLVTKDLSMKFGDGSKFNATVLDGQGNPLAKQNVTFNVNGVFYHKVTDDDGVASLSINLLSGEYIITSIWNNYQVGNKITIA